MQAACGLEDQTYAQRRAACDSVLMIPQRRMRRSNSDTALDQRHLEGTTASEPYADPAVQPPNEASVRASVKSPARQRPGSAHNGRQNGQQQKQSSPPGGGEAQ
jgi:hypothetical protein